jgi:hypothetical protein
VVKLVRQEGEKDCQYRSPQRTNGIRKSVNESVTLAMAVFLRFQRWGKRDSELSVDGTGRSGETKRKSG